MQARGRIMPGVPEPRLIVAADAPVQFNFARKAPQKVARETIIPEPSYNIPLVLAGLHLCHEDLPCAGLHYRSAGSPITRLR